MEYLVGKRITELREKKGLSISQLAKLSGISKSTLWEIENNKISPTISTLWSIANALGVPFSELITYDIVIKDEGSEVRLIEREGNREVYIIKLISNVVKRSEAHKTAPIEIVHVIKGAMIVGPVESPRFIWEGRVTKFYGGIDHVYIALGGDAEAIVTMIYYQQNANNLNRKIYINNKNIKIEKYRDLIEDYERIGNETLANAISAISNYSIIDDTRLVFDILSAEFKTLRDNLTLPKAVFESMNKVSNSEITKTTDFERNIDVLRYYIYEPLHPGYAEQAVYVAYELEKRKIRNIVSIGCGPAYHERILKEIIPDLNITCIENSRFFKELSPFNVIDSIPNDSEAIVSFGSSHHIDNFLEIVTEKLRKKGILIISDEFIKDYSTEKERKINVIRHHLGYLLDIQLPKFRDSLLSSYHTAKNLDLSLSILSKTYLEIMNEIKDEVTTKDIEKAFLNFYYLELTSLMLGIAYIEEKKTSVKKFVSKASTLGLKLVSHYKVYSTGEGKMGSGTHVLVFVKV